MNFSFTFKGQEVDVIEAFSDFVLVQDKKTFNVFLILYEQIDAPDADGYNKENITHNVFSLAGYKTCLKKVHPSRLIKTGNKSNQKNGQLLRLGPKPPSK